MNQAEAATVKSIIPPRRLPLYGINSREIAIAYDMPKDFYTVYDTYIGVAEKYTTSGFEKALSSYEKAFKKRLGDRMIRALRAAVEKEWHSLVVSARELAPWSDSRREPQEIQGDSYGPRRLEARTGGEIG